MAFQTCCQKVYQIYGKNAIKDTFDERDYATLDEIKEIGYEKHVEEKLFII